jgi:hypothetical protein
VSIADSSRQPNLFERGVSVRRFVRENSLALFFGGIFLAAVVGQSLVGVRVYNEEQVQHGGDAISYTSYLVSSHFGQAVLENWQSEFLQFTLYILATVWLVQRGSPESKKPEKAGGETDKDQLVGHAVQKNSPGWAKVGGWRTWLYSNSLVLAMSSIFFACWAVQSLDGVNEYNQGQQEHGDPTISWITYVGGPDFWEDTLQNWQSEFLAVGTMVVFSIYLRQRGSPESKPVGARHDETGRTG